MRLDDAAADGESESGAAAGALGGEERLEDALGDLGRHAGAAVLDLDVQPVGPSGGADGDAGIVAAGLFGFTLSYDEFARTTLLAGEYNTLPLDINASMTQRVRPNLFALGTASTVFSLLMIGLFLVIYTILYRRSR